MPGLAYNLPYYATGLRADQLAEALVELTPELLRLGALEVRVQRSVEDPYRFLQVIQVTDKDAWARIWNGAAFVRFRTVCGPWYQKPLAYAPQRMISQATAPGVTDLFAADPYVTSEVSDPTPEQVG
ncbi:MAG: hypothetical protein ITG02_07180 [Patulibacter sp.]|nr:hypothetical protein [Patulibacter sp.]